MEKQASDVVIFRNLAPVADLNTLSAESRAALTEFRAASGVPQDADLSGEWWGMIQSSTRTFRCFRTQQDAEAAGTELARRAGVAAWLETDGHTSARVLVSCG